MFSCLLSLVLYKALSPSSLLENFKADRAFRVSLVAAPNHSLPRRRADAILAQSKDGSANPKYQNANPREASNTKKQIPRNSQAPNTRSGSSGFGPSLVFGVWVLGFLRLPAKPGCRSFQKSVVRASRSHWQAGHCRGRIQQAALGRRGSRRQLVRR